MERLISEKLALLSLYTGEDETTLLARALRLGLDALYREAAEQAFINEKLTVEEATVVLGAERVKDLAYAKEALAEDIARGLGLL